GIEKKIELPPSSRNVQQQPTDNLLDETLFNTDDLQGNQEIELTAPIQSPENQNEINTVQIDNEQIFQRLEQQGHQHHLQHHENTNRDVRDVNYTRGRRNNNNPCCNIL
uniref:Uncharacterized protein n=1 Tax=Meloidogyne hapla TaxID=6305 RepID=A0A1I8BXB8_MELHA